MKKSSFLTLATNGSITAINAVNKAFNNIIKDAEPGDYSIDTENAIENIEYLIEDIIEEVRYIRTCSYELAENLVKYDAKILQNLATAKAELMNAIKNASKKVKKVFFTENQKSSGKNIIKKYAGVYTIKEIDLYQDIEDYSDETKYRVYVVRMNDGTTCPRGYVVLNPSESIFKSEANYVKANYAVDTDNNYYSTRPILYKNWNKLDEYHKLQTL